MNNYAGYFDLNCWLRTFVRGDIVDEYEKSCLEVVNKYKDKQTSDTVIADLFTELSEELRQLALEIIYERNNM